MPPITAKGFALLDRDGSIDVRTVSPTRRAVQVNALVTHGQMVLDKWSDEFIGELFAAYAKEYDWTLIRVEITGLLERDTL